jgi:hypothetical protein
MGISLKDIGNFAAGAIERDKELTKESLENRKEELKATRAMLIAQKAKRYEKDITKFEEEDKKYKAIQAVNKQFTGKTDVDPAEWGRIYLQNYKPTEYATILKAYGENTSGLNEYLKGFAVNKDFKTFSTEKAIDTKYQDEVKSIMTDTTKQIKDARGDSFLINQILGLRNKKISEAESIKTESATGIEQAKKVNTEVANIETKPEEEVSFTFAKEDKTKTIFVPKLFKDDVKTIRDELNKNTALKKENINQALTYFSKNNQEISKQYLQTNLQGDVTGLKGAGRTFVNHAGQLYNQAIQSFTNEKIFLETNGEKSNISNIINENAVRNVSSERLSNYSLPIGEQRKFMARRDNIIAVVPFSIVSTNNILGNYQFQTRYQKNKVGEAYSEVLKDIAKKENPDATIESNEKFMGDIQEKLLSVKIGSDNPLVKDVKNRMITKLIEKKIINPEDSANNIQVIQVNGMNVPLTDTNKTKLTAMKFDWENAPKANVAKPNIPTSKPAPTPVDVDEQYTTGTEFNVTPQKPVSQMTMAERRVYDKKKRDEQMKLMEDRRKSFNTKVRNINQQSSNTNTIDFNADK